MNSRSGMSLLDKRTPPNAAYDRLRPKGRAKRLYDYILTNITADNCMVCMALFTATSARGALNFEAEHRLAKCRRKGWIF